LCITIKTNSEFLLHTIILQFTHSIQQFSFELQECLIIPQTTLVCVLSHIKSAVILSIFLYLSGADISAMVGQISRRQWGRYLGDSGADISATVQPISVKVCKMVEPSSRQVFSLLETISLGVSKNGVKKGWGSFLGL